VLVPALAFVLGARFWWPAAIDGTAEEGTEQDAAPSPVTPLAY